jgi:hypothetical protein
MKKYLLAAALAAPTALAAVPAFADGQTTIYRQFEFWDVVIDHTANDTCAAITRADHGDMILRIGYDRKYNFPFIYIEKSGWVSLVENNKYDVSIQVNGYPSETAVGVGTHDAVDKPALLIPISNTMWNQLSAGSGVSVYYKGAVLFGMRLVGSYPAMNAVTQCQQQFGSPPSDPFAGNKGSAPTDPFKPNT